MINLTTLYANGSSTSDGLRYGKGTDAPATAGSRRPVVVWNCTRRCNLACRHCYSSSRNQEYPGELTNAEARDFIKDLADFGVPALLLSGGEPLMRHDLLDLLTFARSLGLRVTLSTNGTLIDAARAKALAEAGVVYVGVSLDGVGETHDRFRGHVGAFEETRAGIRALRAEGVRTGLRLTLARQSVAELEALFAFAEEEGIERICFYHLVPVGRGRTSDLLSVVETRAAVDRIMAKSLDFVERGLPVEILTVDGHFDGPYMYTKLRERDATRAEEVLERMRWNGGALNSTGVGISSVNWEGVVHPDQFLRSVVLGSIRERPFSQIWSNPDDAVLTQLRDKRAHLGGRCLGCRFLDVCGGGLRARAEAMSGDRWAPDPACYLSDEEISV
ncbi:MAG: radical SAM protein [Actinomycetota bacterium]